MSYSKITLDHSLRDYRLFRPPSLDTGKAVAVVILLPAPTADAELMESVIHLDSEATTAGFLLATPNGCGAAWSDSPGPENSADERFVREMIQQLRSEYRVSTIFAVSISGGSRMLYRLACDLADEITAVADVAGTMILKDDCKPARPVSILEIHGTADVDSPWAGGGPHGSYPVEAVNERWRTLDGCSGAPTVRTSGITVISVWMQCTGAAVVQLDKVVGGKHTWFGSGDQDAVPGEPDANSVIWSFFSGLKQGNF